MSGGHFDYWDHHITTVADKIEELIATNDSDELNEWGDPVGHHFTPETIEKFKKAACLLRQAFVYAHRIDYLISGDDSEKSFHERLEEDLHELSKDTNKKE